MGFKKKVVGILAAAALTLSMGAGIAAADPVETNGEVNLHPGYCQLSVDAGDMDYGTWTWDGSGYKLDEGSDASDSMDLIISVPRDQATCQLSWETGGLYLGGDTSDTDNNIPVDSFSWSVAGESNLQSPFPAPQGDWALNITLDEVPDVEDGEYTGTMTFTLSGD